MPEMQNKRSAQVSNASVSARSSCLLPEDAARVRELIAGRHSKAALQVAKDLHKRAATSDSETLLVDAYRARIEDLTRLRMTVEAKALLAIARERFAAAVSRWEDLEQELCVLDGRLDGIVGPLRNPGLSVDERARIETFIRQRVDDLPALAAVSSLPPEHSLRVAASALAAAFQAVTAGNLDDELMTLPQVSRRSPLAPWKVLVRAIACYYRHEDAECREWLVAIPEDAVPARLIPAMSAMLGTKCEVRFTATETALIEAAGDHGAALRSSVAMLETAFAARKKQPILDGVRAVAATSIGLEPALRERLRQHVAVRCVAQHMPRRAADSALGGSPRLDASYYRLLARSLEELRYEESSAEAVIVWEEFRRAAIRENWFAAGELEDGVLSLHMAEMVEKLPPDVLADMHSGEVLSHRRDRGRSREGPPSPEMLFERACQADASTEAFEAWLRWAKKQQNEKVADEVGECWRKARPGDIQPLLHLMESAEKRNALKKSLKYLEEAERLDGLNPAVRRAKARLLVSSAVRHLRQGQSHLIPAEIEQLLTVPEVRPGDVAALAAALHWCRAAIERNTAAQHEWETKLVRSIGPVAAHLMGSALAMAAQWRSHLSVSPLDARHTPEELVAGAVRACMLGDWVGLSIPLPFAWTAELIEALKQPVISVDATQLVALGETALKDSARELAYAISSAGLSLRAANARFLFLRARALPAWTEIRRVGCLAAAGELARRERDMELAGRILDRLNGRLRLSTQSDALSAELVDVIVEEELKFRKYPAVPRDDQPRYAAQLTSVTAPGCDCPKCRAKRGEPIDDWDDEDEEEAWDDEEDDFDDPLQGMPAVLAAILEALSSAERRRVLRVIEAGDPIKVLDMIDQVINKTSPGSAAPKSRWKPPKAAESKRGKQAIPAPDQSPTQGRLF
jgi:hypothetical protein